VDDRWRHWASALKLPSPIRTMRRESGENFLPKLKVSRGCGRDRGFNIAFERPDASRRRRVLLDGTGETRRLLGTVDGCAAGDLLSPPRGGFGRRQCRGFFRRFAEGILMKRTSSCAQELVGFHRGAAVHMGCLMRRNVIAFGYSNGAKHRRCHGAAASGALSGAIRWRPMVATRAAKI